MTKKTREQAAYLCQLYASNLKVAPGLYYPIEIWDALGVTWSKATTVAWLASCEANKRAGGSGILTREDNAEAESMLRTGWEPRPEDMNLE